MVETCMVRRQVYKAWEFTSLEELQKDPIPGVYCDDGIAFCMTQQGPKALGKGDRVILAVDHSLEVVKPAVFEQAFEEVTDPTV